MSADGTVVQVEGLEKTFTLHTQGGVSVPVLEGLDFAARAGECVALFGPSGSGKSTLLRCLYANYKPQAGKILVRHGDHVVDMVAAELRTVLEVRRWTIGYVSQFLRVIPRVSSLDIVVEPLITRGYEPDRAYEKGRALLARLGLPERLWSLAPATFSGGEQQRINVARCVVADYPVLLLDEPTASLDATNRHAIVELIQSAKKRGAAVAGIFHDDEVRAAVADRIFPMGLARAAA